MSRSITIIGTKVEGTKNEICLPFFPLSSPLLNLPIETLKAAAEIGSMDQRLYFSTQGTKMKHYGGLIVLAVVAPLARSMRVAIEKRVFDVLIGRGGREEWVVSSFVRNH